MNISINQTSKSGSSILELLIVMGLMVILLPALLTGLYSARSGKAQQNQRIQALTLLKTTEEAVRNIRDQGWSLFATNGTYHPALVSNAWTLSSGTTTVNGFTQTVVISDVYRNSSGAVVSSGGTLDPSTKQVYVSIVWGTPLPTVVDSTIYLTRHSSITYEETQQAQFNDTAVSKTNIKVQASASNPTPTPDDGEIVLSQTGGYGDWCNPGNTLASIDLPRNGVANAISAIVGKAAVGTGNNASGVAYADISISDPIYPTPPSLTSPGNYSASIKTNAVFTESQYAYLATDTNGQQGIILRLSDYKVIGYLNIGTSSVNGKSIYVVNNYAYLTGSNGKLYSFNIANRGSCTPTATCTYSPASNVTLSGTGNKIIVVNNNAYIATSATTNQLQIVNVSSPSSLPSPTSISLNGLGATDIYVNAPQNRGYVVTAQSSTKAEFFVVDLSTNSVLGTYDTHNDGNGDMDPKGVIAVSGAKVIIVGLNGREYEVLRVDGNYENAPAYCGGKDINTGVNGVATVFTAGTTNRAFSYIITNADPEFLVIEGGPGGVGAGDYLSNGTFISKYYGPTANDTFFYSFTAHIYQPVVDINAGFYGVQMQVAAADPVSGSCANAAYTFIGTDATGTGTTHYFTTSTTGSTTITGTIPFDTISTYKNPSKCFKYKVILNTNDSTLTSVFKDITVALSPP